MTRWEEGAKKWSGLLDLPEDQAVPCLITFVCLRYHGKSFVFKMAKKSGKVSLWESLKIGVALFRWGRALKKDPWGEQYRITKFAERWKESEDII